ncbi:Mini-ribonuclease 3 [Veillonella sp. R32]|uniref:Mini-ribonuclease 3 n=1 Tax=Veillonella sp. R32 TaxID=2021312 RepID=UPI0013893ED2|nr:ribonuclease III domain-containing protein [Veillonella sp. R32]KAF1679166.1 hypothetical protein VER_09480 [Veillonella sp. R32]
MNFKRYQFLRATAIEKLKAIKEHEGNTTAGAEDSLMLAYIGDAVYSLFVRERMTEAGIMKVQVLHNLVTECICAKAQAKVLQAWDEAQVLTEAEQQVSKRARNSNVHVPKSATVQEYRASTAFEAVLGYLYRTGQTERLEILMAKAFQYTLDLM